MSRTADGVHFCDDSNGGNENSFRMSVPSSENQQKKIWMHHGMVYIIYVHPHMNSSTTGNDEKNISHTWMLKDIFLNSCKHKVNGQVQITLNENMYMRRD